jgi:prevent-host-death family protein
MLTVNTHEAKSRLSALIANVEKTREEVIICRNGTPVARLVPIEPSKRDPLKKHAELHGSYYVDNKEACAPLDPEDWPEALEE